MKVIRASCAIGVVAVLATACGSNDTGLQSTGDFFESVSIEQRQANFDEAQVFIADCMRQLGFEYVPPERDQEVLDALDIQHVDPTYTVRTLASADSFGMSLDEQQIEAFLDSPLSEPEAEAGPSDLAYAIALHGLDDEPGCEQQAREEVGPWSIESAFTGFQEQFGDALDALQADSDMISLSSEFGACMAMEGYPHIPLLAPVAAVGFDMGQLMAEAARNGRLSDDAGVSAVIAESEELDRVMFESYRRCAAPLADEVGALVDDYMAEYR